MSESKLKGKRDYIILDSAFLVQVIDLSHVGFIPVNTYDGLDVVTFNPNDLVTVEVLGAWNLEPLANHVDELREILKRSI